ncbi:MAG: hypothetical protein Pg6C_05010 [Treponemataceae bacterium]|nr:MAG: hypothetical protein Pg6C_05010 [Treponemataceae bacterium]
MVTQYSFSGFTKATRTIGFATEVPEEGAVWTNSQIPGENLQGIGAAPGKPDSGGVSVPGSYPYGDRDTAEVRGVASGRIYQRKKRDNNSPGTTRGGKKTSADKISGVWIYYVSTVGREEESIKKYIRKQEDEDKRLDQLEMFKDG